MERVRDNTSFTLDGRTYTPVLGRDFFWQIEDVMQYLIKHGNSFNGDGIPIATLGENRRRKTPILTSLSVVHPLKQESTKRSKEYLKNEYAVKLVESKASQLKLWENTGYDFSKGSDLFIGMKVKVFLKDKNLCTYKTCPCNSSTPTIINSSGKKSSNSKNHDDNNNGNGSNSNSENEQEGRVCSHSVLGVVTCVLPEAFEFEALWGVVYDPDSLLSFFDFNYNLPSSSTSSSSSSTSSSSSSPSSSSSISNRGKECFSVYSDVFGNHSTPETKQTTPSSKRSRSGSYTGYEGNERDRRTAILAGFESLCLLDLQKALTAYHKNEVCSDMLDVEGIECWGGTHRDHPMKVVKSSTPVSKRNINDESMTEKSDKESDKEKEKEKEIEKKRLIDEESKETAVAHRITMEVELVTKKLQKKKDSEIKKLNDTIEALTEAAAQSKISEVENEKKRMNLLKSIAILKKEKDKDKQIAIEKKTKDNKWSIEMSILKKNISELKQETAAKLLNKDAQLLLLKKSYLEEKDDLRLELGAGKRKEILELTQIIESLRSKQGNSSTDMNGSRKRSRDEEVQDDIDNPPKMFKGVENRVADSSTHPLSGELSAHTAGSGTNSSLRNSHEDTDAVANANTAVEIVSQHSSNTPTRGSENYDH